MLDPDTAAVVDDLLGPWMQRQVGKNDMTIASALLTAASIICAVHCQRTGDGFPELRQLAMQVFSTSLDVMEERLAARPDRASGTRRP